MKYAPAPVPRETSQLAEFLRRELRRISDATGDDIEVVQYRTRAAAASLSAGVSANWKVNAGNVILCSTSSTLTLTGLDIGNRPAREITLVNTGTGVLVLLSEDAGSSASLRFALPATWQLSANASATLWYDATAARLRGIART